MLFAFGAMSPEAVAEAGYKGMMKGKTLVIPGVKNKLVPLGVNFVPRPLLRRLVDKVNQSD